MDNAAPWSHRFSSKHSSAKCRIPPYEVVGQETTEVSKTIETIATVLGWPPELDDWTLLLKILYIWVAGQRSQKLPLCWLAFLAAEAARKAAGRENSAMVLPRCGAWNNTNEPGKALGQLWHTCLGSNQLLLIYLRPAPLDGMLAGTINLMVKSPWQGKSQALRKNLLLMFCFVFLNGHIVKPISAHICLHPRLLLLSALVCRCFFLKWVIIVVETHNWQNAENNGWVLFSKQDIYISPSKAQATSQKRGQKSYKSWRVERIAVKHC